MRYASCRPRGSGGLKSHTHIGRSGRRLTGGQVGSHSQIILFGMAPVVAVGDRSLLRVYRCFHAWLCGVRGEQPGAGPFLPWLRAPAG